MKFLLSFFLLTFLLIFSGEVKAESSVLINEFTPQPSPQMVELINTETVTIDISHWYIDDMNNGGATPKQFSISIPANSYAIYELSSGIPSCSGFSRKPNIFQRSNLD